MPRITAERIRLLLVQNGVLIALVLLIALFAILNPRFISVGNLQTIVLQIAELGLIALPVAFLIMQANVDLSVGSVATLSAVVGGLTMVGTGSPVAGIVVGVAVGACAGLVNGTLVSVLGLNSFVVTLGFMSAWSGLALFLTNGKTVSGLPSSFTSLGSFAPFGVRIQIILLVAAIVVAWWVLNHTTRGREILAVGGNLRASQLMGLRINRIRVSTYVVTGAVAGFVGLLLAAKLGAVSPIVGQGMELDALTVVLLGGVAFEGGSGRIRSVLYGLAFVGVLKNGLVILGISPYIQTILVGLTLGIAVGLDRGFLTVTLAHITFSMCFVAVVVQSRLLTFDRSLEEAAMDLGAPPVKTFFQITLPVILPAVISGWMLAFTLSLDDLVIASFTSGPGATTLPMKIYSQVRLGVTPEINAACTILIAIVALGVIAASLVNKRREVQRLRDEQAAQRG